MINILINGQVANVRNIRDIGFKLNFREANYSDQELNVDTLVCVNETKEVIENWVLQYGYHVGIPTTITCGSMSYDYYIDLTDKPPFRSREVEVKIKKRKGKDNFFDVANAMTFELLNAKGVIFPKVPVQYVIVKDNQLELGLTLGIATFSMIQASIQAIRDTAYLIEEAIAAVAGLSVAMAISAIAKAIVQAAYTISLIIAAVKLASQFKELIFPKIRTYDACKVKDLLTYACQNMGYSFSSTFLDSIPDLTFLGVPIQKTNKSIFNFLQNQLNQSFTKGYPTAQDTIPTVGNLIGALEVAFRLKTKVINGTVYLENEAFFQNLANLSIVPALNLQDSRQLEYTVNSSDAVIRTYVHYQTDFNDLFTVNNFEPNDAEYGFLNTNQIANAPELNLIKGLNDVNIPFSLASTKTEFNYVEQLALEFFTAIDVVTGTSTALNIIDRLGVMQISQQFYGVSKLMNVVNGKQTFNYKDILSANNIYLKYHEPYNIQTQGFKEIANAPLPMNFDEFSQLSDINYATIDGEKCKVLEVDFIESKSKAVISYEVPYNFANGKISTFAINV